MRIAIIGSTGFLGKKFVKILSENNEIIEINRNSNNLAYKLNLDNAETFDYRIFNNIDYVLFLAAISSPDKCFCDYDYCYKTNVIGTKIAISNILNYKCKVIFFSSDAVFSGLRNDVATEKTIPCPITAYGEMKLIIENTFITDENFKIARLSYVLAENDKFITYIKNCQKSLSNAEIYHPFYRNVIFVDEVIESVKYLLKNWMNFTSNILNVTGNELISRLNIIDIYNSFFSDKVKYAVQKPDDTYFLARPCITEMRSCYMSDILSNYDLSFSEKIKKYILKGE